VSRWSRDRLVCRLSPERLVFALNSRGATREWFRAIDLTDPFESVFGAALAALEVELSQQPSRVALTVILPASMVRYTVIPWHADFMTGDARAGFIRYCFTESFGESAAAWQFMASDTRWGAPAIGAAIDEALVGALRSLRGAHVASVSIQPMLMSEFNLARKRITPESFWFVIDDATHFTLLLTRNAAPILVKVARHTEGSLESLIEREWLVHGLEGERCPIFLAQAEPSQAKIPTAAHWEIIRIARTAATASRSPLFAAFSA